MLPFENTTLSAAERADDLLARLSIDEKIGMLNMKNCAVPRLHIPAYHWWNEGLHGVARNGKATMFPQSIAIAATFTPEYAHEMGKIIREEARIKHSHLAKHGQRGIYCGLNMFSPNINIFRDPRWGRGHETYGECPVLTSLMGTAYITGVQGDDPEHLECCATLKHFAVHSGPEGVRSSFNTSVSERDLQQTYLYAFRYCMEKSGVKNLMASYNAVDGVPMAINRKMLFDVLRREWNFQSVVVTDVATAANLVNEFKICKDMPEALALQISAGVDVCSELGDHIPAYMREAYDRGLLKEDDINRAIRNQLILKFQLGLLDPLPETDYSRLECKEHRAISRRIAERSPVLLKNNGILPLKDYAGKKIAVIGPTAADVEVLRGNYSGTATKYVTILDGMLETFGEDQVIYARGCEILRSKTELCGEPGDRLAEAAIAAEQADLVILSLGLTPEFEGEAGDAGNSEAGGDKASLDLPAVQTELLETVLAAGKPVILLNCSGSAIAIPEDKVDAALQVFYPGPEGGRVIADILTGKVNPSGRLPVTFYCSTEKLPPFEDYSMKNRTYRYCSENILYPFGYGLSYTTFEYSALTAENCPEGVRCQLTVSNTGMYAGETAIPFFFRHENGPAYEPLKQFAGAIRLHLNPGERQEICFTYPAEFLQFADEEGVFHPITGGITFMVEEQKITIHR